MPAFYGIIIYEVLAEGNLLSAVYTNNGLRHQNGQYDIDNEIARLVQSNNPGFGGTYTCRYIESPQQQVVQCTLTITPRGEVYDCEWMNGTQQLWVGIGMMAGPHHFAVSYTEP